MIDADFEGEIKVMTHSLDEISIVKSGKKQAKLILLHQMQTNNQVKRDNLNQVQGGKSGFGSSDAYWLQAIGSQCPELTLFISGRASLVPWILVQMCLLQLPVNGLLHGQKCR